MEISKTNSGASTYALKKSLETPKNLITVLENASANQAGTLAENKQTSAPVDMSNETGKGKIIDISA